MPLAALWGPWYRSTLVSLLLTGNPESGAEMKKEIGLLKTEVDSLSTELRVKEDEIRQLTRQLSDRSGAGDSSEAVKVSTSDHRLLFY
jgi:hypothetical protein